MAKTKGEKESKPPRSIQNRKAKFDYHIEDGVEAGIALQGSEVKSIYLGRAHLNDAYCRIIGEEAFLINMDVDPYEKSSVFSHERRRDRKLLLHRKQIESLRRQTQEKGYTLVPLSVYFKENGKVKVWIGVGRGKAHYDKREKIASDDARREADRVRKGRGDEA